MNGSLSARIVICLDNTGYETSLDRDKIYVAISDALTEQHAQLRVFDESGEAYLYPAEKFENADKHDPSIDAQWLKEAEDRLAAYRSGELAAVDAERVFGDLRTELPLSDAERAELDRVLDAYERDGNPGRPAEDVIAEIKTKL